MATSGEGSNPYDRATLRPLAQLQELESRMARRRLSQAHHRATLAGLFNSLREIVYSQSDLTPSKWQILNKAKNHIQDLEQTLDNLLKVKEFFHLDDGNANSLEEVREAYTSMCFRSASWVSNEVHQKGYANWSSMEAVGNNTEQEEGEREENQEEEDEGEEQEEEIKVELLHPAVTLSPDFMEFERYLNFYKHTADLLVRNGIVSSQEVMLPIISAAISHLWQNLPEEWKASLLEAWAQNPSSAPGPMAEACPDAAWVEDSMKDSGIDSQGTNGLLFSTAEELLFEDAFDMTCFEDKSEAPSTSSPSSVFASCNLENPEGKFQLYMQIIDFFKGLCCANTQVKQKADLPMDEELLMLRCTETFDDEDL